MTEVANASALNFRPFDRQADPLLSEAEVIACVTGARGGKTQAGCFRMLMDAIEQPDYWPDDVEKGKPYTIAIGAPTFPMLQRIILPTFLSMVPEGFAIRRYHQTKKLLRIRGRCGESHVYFLSGKAFESWMGMSLYRAWLDEFCRVKEALFDEVAGVRLSDRRGKILLTSTPEGPNWAYERIYKPWREWSEMTEAQRELDPHHPGRKIDFYTWRTVENPYLPQGFIAEKRRSLPPRFFRRTFEATWETFAGQVYEEFYREVHVRQRSAYRFKLPNGRVVGKGPNLIPLIRVVAGVDWGFAPGHLGAIVVAGQDTAPRWWPLEESVAEGVLVLGDVGQDSWIHRAQVIRTRWGVERFFCDTEAPDKIASFKRAGLPAVNAVKDVRPGIECLAKAMHIDPETNEPGFYVLDDLHTTIDQITYYHWKDGKEEPEKVNDDTCDAGRYAIYSCELRGRFQREPRYVA